ncbi:hypothetical protein SAMN05660748_2531 [Blastococcus aggregatus]|uniref:Uncharacterized protein n=1 Tax=Blastococcus aggregatus TaxID=38502 RepID=A0A285V6X0_9ACTN|nr:hypothetical protein [Blastococcus aggregatus]SOC49799.1 hypothetical protein SAMN05660748_2531 [Blastococcus aggregatus]
MLFSASVAIAVLPLLLFFRSFAQYRSRCTSRWGCVVQESAVIAVMVVAMGLAALAAVWAEELSRVTLVGVVSAAGIAATVGGAVVATSVLRLADTSWPHAEVGMAHQGELVGAAWLGPMERLVTYACLCFSWPEGVAALLLLKSWGRQEDLKKPVAGPRFMIGTLASLLWAAAAAGVVWAART